MKRARRWATAGVVAGAMAAAPAAAENVVASNPWMVMSALQSYGMAATLETDSDGDPKVSSRISETKFSVYFYGCDDSNNNCKSVQFSAGYNLNDGLSAARVNQWNRDKRFASAYIDDEDDPFLKMDVNLDYEGVGTDNFEDTIDIWRLQVEAFEDFIDW